MGEGGQAEIGSGYEREKQTQVLELKGKNRLRL
jgi:hypothetical protein